MGVRRNLLVIAAATVTAVALACQTPTSMTVAVWTNVVCEELQPKSAANIIVGTPEEIVGDLTAASTKTCERQGDIGEVVLLPKENESAEVAFKVVLGVRRNSDDCGVVDTGEPAGVWAGCIIARRRLSFLEGEALVVDVRLYEECIGVPCDEGTGDTAFTTCVEGGRCVPADLDPTDCLGGGCGDGDLGGSVTSAASTSSTGAGGAAPGSSSGQGGAPPATGGGGEGGAPTASSSGGEGGASTASTGTGAGGTSSSGGGEGGAASGGGFGGATGVVGSSVSTGSGVCNGNDDCFTPTPCREAFCSPEEECGETLALVGDACDRGQGLGRCDENGNCVECLDEQSCPVTNADCFMATCSATGECGELRLQEGVDCQGGSGVCSPSGDCVECTQESHCLATEDCDPVAFECVGMDCDDLQTNGDETDMNCGGDDCAPCDNFEACQELPSGPPEDASCISGICEPDGNGSYWCVGCSTDLDCANGEYCPFSGGDCTAQQDNGTFCMSDSWCLTDQCWQGTTGSGVCCDDSCTGSCMSCRGSDTGGDDGACTFAQFGDPQDDCPQTMCHPGTCDGAGSCAVNEGQPCGPPICNEQTDAITNYRCDADGACTAETVPCPSGEICINNSCAADPSSSSAGATTGSSEPVTSSTTVSSTTTGGGVTGPGGGLDLFAPPCVDGGGGMACPEGCSCQDSQCVCSD